jgi:Leucine-rich repeat (LRR) protein
VPNQSHMPIIVMSSIEYQAIEYQAIEYQTIDGKMHRDKYKYYTSIHKLINVNKLRSIISLDLSRNRIKKIEGFDSLVSLQNLDLSYNRITKIEGLEKLISIQKLNLSNNQIRKIGGLEKLVSLELLHLSDNRITKMEGLANLRSLQKLYLYLNKIMKIEELDSLGSLQVLHLSNNQITKIEGLEKLVSLQLLFLNNNRIVKIEGLDSSISLRELYLDSNLITKIEGLDNLGSLKMINLIKNKIQTIPISIINLRQLDYLYCDIPLNPIIQRFLNRNQIKSKKTIYSDGQNVHDSQINRSITESLYRLLDEKVSCADQGILDEIINDNILSTESKEALVEYSKITSVHSQLNVTFMEALRCIWTVIRDHKQSDEIKKILDHEIQDSICKCFTGRLSRLVNTLNGFDERVSVRISDEQEISNVIISVTQKTNNLEEQQGMITKELVERGYSKQMIDQWLVYLE